jgi:membrane-associated phospholipid phosphatase
MTPMGRWLLTFLTTVLVVVISYQWLDRPIAVLAKTYLQFLPHHKEVEGLSHSPNPLIPLAVCVLLALGLWSLSGRPLSKMQTAALFCSVSVIVTEAAKNLLKFFFGRTWPETWIQNNPSFLRDGAYGFNILHGGVGYESFPSGHSAIACAVISVLWVMYPRYRPLYSIVVLLVAFGLIGPNFHFLSDVIAGAFVGTTTGWMAVALGKACDSPSVPK